jgi:zinc protease
MFRWLLVPVVLALLPTPRALAARPYSEQVVERTLDNGFRMLLLEDHKAPVAVVQIWYRVGSRNEISGHTGLSHILEHMMFKGTNSRGPEDYSRTIARNGGNENAFTAEDATTYFATLAADRIDVELDLEADRMRNLKLTDDQFLPERQVVMEERRLRTDDNPIAFLDEALDATTFFAHPYRNPVIGWATDIAGAQVADLASYYDQFYQPSNAFLVAVGDFQSQALGDRIAALFGAIPRGEPPPKMLAIEPEQTGPRRVEIERPAKLPYIALQYHTPNLHQPDSPALEVLSEVLSHGKSARLYRELVFRQRLALDADASYDRTSIDPKTFTIAAQAQPGIAAAKLERALLEQVTAVQSAPPTAEELARAKAQIEAAFVFSQDSMFYRALVLGTYEVAGGWRQIDDYLPAIGAVTAADVQRVAKQYLTERNRTVGVLIPLAGAEPPPVEHAPAGGVR